MLPESHFALNYRISVMIDGYITGFISHRREGETIVHKQSDRGLKSFEKKVTMYGALLKGTCDQTRRGVSRQSCRCTSHFPRGLPTVWAGQTLGTVSPLGACYSRGS